MKLPLTLLLSAVFSSSLLAQSTLTVSIATPPNGTVVEPGNVLITANAQDAVGYVTDVVYVLDGAFSLSFTEPPYEFLVNVSSGRHVVRAFATNDNGSWAISAPSYFQIGNNIPVNVLRGPYLQSCTATGVVVRWRTDWPTNSIVWFGPAFPGTLFSVTNHVRTNDHEVQITGLTPGSSYFYSVGSDTETLATGIHLRFHTAPTNTQPVTVWVIGDAGTRDEKAAGVRDAYLSAVGPLNTDLWLMLGDNAYEDGTDDEFQTAVFDTYAQVLNSVPLWPTIGNHDVVAKGSPGEFPYLDMFTLPKNGEAGGLPSGTEKYYAFDYANIHFICLDSETSSRAPDGPMFTWLREDLAATDKDWIVAFWHHPPYSFGTHDSDIETQLVQMRAHALPMLESYGVDLVLSGHSHVYERSFLINGHYGHSSTLTTNMVLDGSAGGSAGPYRKPAGGLGADHGTVYAVCGNSGQGGDGHYARHPAMAFNTNGNGSMILRFNGLRLEAQFLRPDGSIEDEFAIDKSGPTTILPELSIARTITGFALSWPTSLPAYALQSAPAVATNAVWQDTTSAVTQVGRRNVVNQGLEGSRKFFRLKSEF